MPYQARRKKAGKVDWEALEDRYVEEDLDLFYYSSDYPPNDKTCHPSMSTLRQRAYEGQWVHKRRARIKNDTKAEVIETIGKDRALQAEIVQIEITSRDELLNANRAILKHLRLANDLQQIGAELVEKAKQVVHRVDLADLAENDVKGFIGALKIITDFLTAAADMERRALKVSDLKVEFAITSNQDDTENKLSQLKSMDTAELMTAYMAAVKEDK
jgi:hypothetical protein